jgi:hypothetical protein
VLLDSAKHFGPTSLTRFLQVSVGDASGGRQLQTTCSASTSNGVWSGTPPDLAR